MSQGNRPPSRGRERARLGSFAWVVIAMIVAGMLLIFSGLLRGGAGA